MAQWLADGCRGLVQPTACVVAAGPQPRSHHTRFAECEGDGVGDMWRQHNQRTVRGEDTPPAASSDDRSHLNNTQHFAAGTSSGRRIAGNRPRHFVRGRR